jgi:acetyl esterase/lipase
MRGMRYGDAPRCTMDVYAPASEALTGTSAHVDGGPTSNKVNDGCARKGSGGGDEGDDLDASGERRRKLYAIMPQCSDACGVQRAGTTTGRPIVLFVHGGVWASGDAWNYAPLAARLARAGAVVAVMQYSLYPSACADRMVRVTRCVSCLRLTAPSSDASTCRFEGSPSSHRVVSCRSARSAMHSAT